MTKLSPVSKTEVVERFAIRIEGDRYSKGPSSLPVSLEKAKLWSSIGHIKSHLAYQNRNYPPTAEVVRVEIRYVPDINYKGNVNLKVSDLVAEGEKKQKERRARADEANARRQIKDATEKLKEARAKLQKISK